MIGITYLLLIKLFNACFRGKIANDMNIFLYVDLATTNKDENWVSVV